jgi:hypothetical protein
LSPSSARPRTSARQHGSRQIQTSARSVSAAPWKCASSRLFENVPLRVGEERSVSCDRFDYLRNWNPRCASDLREPAWVRCTEGDPRALGWRGRQRLRRREEVVACFAQVPAPDDMWPAGAVPRLDHRTGKACIRPAVVR